MIPRETAPFGGRPALTLAVATAITGGFVALAAPATADAGHVPGPAGAQVTHAGTQATPSGDHAVRAVSARGGDPRGADDCPPGPPGPPGPRGRLDGVSGAYATPTGGVTGEYLADVQGNGTTLIRDPSSITPNLPWHDISTLTGYPGSVTGVALAVSPIAPNVLDVTVRSITGVVAQTSCILTVNPAWPTNCTAFTSITPPL
ncbi:hypothetical protein GCM10009677_46250 [Sphaerisporangium rubeum]|uniref:Uncharacterized protein n=1 Tax=Sphaerisporangium rubeum TaxID=321317 RepID=A0A7X0M615_9ACTN|nr:hypothetical protein [Sphaerisporangium rubeum]MBB6472757.1 hypothetical protein [Sphaerisporangium rubeum]